MTMTSNGMALATGVVTFILHRKPAASALLLTCPVTKTVPPGSFSQTKTATHRITAVVEPSIEPPAGKKTC